MTTCPLRVAAALLLFAAAGPALSQSSVTLGGVADAGLRHVKNDGVAANRSMVSGANQTSRFYLRGVEDLGGGLSAGFHLEHGLALNTGVQASSTSGQFWDRRATLSLIDKRWGEVRAGRDFVPSYTNWTAYDPFTYVGVAGSNHLISAAPAGPIRSAFSTHPNTTVRANDAVQYLLPAGLGGLEGGVMLAPAGSGTAAEGKNKVVGLRLGWARGATRVSAARTTSENNLTTAGKFSDTVLAGATSVASVRLSAAVRRFEVGSAEQTNLLLGLVVPVGRGEVRASWQKADHEGRVGTTSIAANGATQIGLGYVHSLSRRSALYATASRIANEGALTLAVPGGTAGMAAGGTSKAIEIGVRHTF